LTFSADRLFVRHYRRAEAGGRTAYASGMVVVRRLGFIWRFRIPKILLIGKSCRVTIALVIPMATLQLPR
jgi:hypothetical protein